jgi:heme exporter protein C
MKRFAIGLYVVATIVLLGWAYYEAIYVAPTDAMQGEIFRIIFYHVPSAAVAFVFFGINLFASVWFIWATLRVPEGMQGIEKWLFWIVFFLFSGRLTSGLFDLFRKEKRKRVPWNQWFAGTAQTADAWALSGAEVGVVFCTVVLLTGPIWGRRAWGIWWTWDARLTTTLTLWLIYVSYLLLRRFAAGPQVQTIAAVLGIFGGLDVPIVYMSNRWWRTQHPAPVFGGAPGSGMDKSMLPAFGWNMLAWFAWGILILAIRYRLERQHQKIEETEAEEALRA